MSEELSSSSTSVPLPIPIPIYHFDGVGRKGESDGENNDGDGGKEVKYYNRRKKQEVIQEQDPYSHEPLQASSSEPIPETGNVTIPLIPTPELVPEDQNLDQPITLKKGVRSCTQHPLANFVSYHSLSPTFHKFSIAFSAISVPRSVSEAMQQLQWRNAMEENASVGKEQNMGTD